MGKSSKAKKNKVRKITEEEYTKYLSSLKEEEQVCNEQKIQLLQTGKNDIKKQL